MHNYIDKWSISEVEDHLNKQLNLSVVVTSYTIAGEGNMNFTYRISTECGQSFIIKQSPPFCAKFPSIPAPEKRIHSELQYYGLTDTNDNLREYSPTILGFDEQNLIAYMTDLGSGQDYETLYDLKSPRLAAETREQLVHYLKNLHSLDTSNNPSFKNTEMRRLNADYIFKLPFDAKNTAINLDDITDGLQAEALKFKNNKEIRRMSQELEKSYWQDTTTLIHGDYYPRSWLETDKGLFVIDPEFSFYGVPEFDLSVYLAHMSMCNDFNMNYLAVKNHYGDYNEELLSKLIAVEIFRRVMFVSQLPLHNSLKFKKELLDRSKEALITGKINSFFGDIDV
jgi:5-methylthioribose kinase